MVDIWQKFRGTHYKVENPSKEEVWRENLRVIRTHSSFDIFLVCGVFPVIFLKEKEKSVRKKKSHYDTGRSSNFANKKMTAAIL